MWLAEKKVQTALGLFICIITSIAKNRKQYFSRSSRVYSRCVFFARGMVGSAGKCKTRLRYPRLYLPSISTNIYLYKTNGLVDSHSFYITPVFYRQ